MSAVLTERQEVALIEAATVHRHLEVPDVALVARLGVLVDARVPTVRDAIGQQQAAHLAVELHGYLRGQPSYSTHGHERAAAVLQDVRVSLADRSPGTRRVVLSGASDLDVTAEVLANHPHGALIVAIAFCDGRSLAARWS